MQFTKDTSETIQATSSEVVVPIIRVSKYEAWNKVHPITAEKQRKKRMKQGEREKKLKSRQEDYANTMKGNSDIVKKHPNGFKKPGSVKK